MKLNLGCSDDLHPDFLNVDIVAPTNKSFIELTRDELKASNDTGWVGKFFKADLRKTWPFPTESIEEIRAHDIFEHLPSKVDTMNEAWRVLEPGGILDLFIPTTDGRGAFQDPTHVSFWTPNDMYYFCDYFAEWIRFHEAYGIKAQFHLMLQNGMAANSGMALAAIKNGECQFPGMITKWRGRLVAVKE